LIWSWAIGESPVVAKIDAIEECWVLLAEFGLGPALAFGKGVASPDFIKPTWVALVASDKVFGADPKPTGHPDINSVILIEWAPSHSRGWGF